MVNPIIETALGTGERIQTNRGNIPAVARILHTPPGIRSSATAGMIITLGIALAPRWEWKHKSLATARLRRTAQATPRPSPLMNMAADLLHSIETRGKGYITTALIHQAELCRNNIQESAAALEQLNPLRDQYSAYYSSSAAATLMSHMAVDESLDWADPDTLRSFRMADYACGHGALLVAACQRV